MALVARFCGRGGGVGWVVPPVQRAFASAAQAKVGTAGLDWSSVLYEPVKVNGHAKCTWSQAKGWSPPTFVREDSLQLSIWANVLHYGQSIFEGQKAFQCKDGKVRIFNDHLNHERMVKGSQRLMLPEVPLHIFQDTIDMAVRENAEFIPPYGQECSLYVRPLLFGSNEQLALYPATEVTFLVMVAPVGAYYKGGKLAGVPAVVVENCDRAAPMGVGHVKAAGNYAADMQAGAQGKEQGYAVGLYLDPKERRYIEEFNTSNFVAIVGNKFLTPDSESILSSITNRSLIQIAKAEGLEVEKRPIDFLAEVESFEEVGAVGTAVVITPVKSITYGSKTWEFKATTKLQMLHDKLRQVQKGEDEDSFGFLREITL